MKDLYKAADSPDKPDKPEPKWIEVQRAVFTDSSFADRMIQRMALTTVRIPIVRKAIAGAKYKFTIDSEEVNVEAGKTVILDLVSSLMITPQL